MARQRSHSIEFKRQVAQEFIAGETLHGLVARHGISRNLIRIWVMKFEAGAFLAAPHSIINVQRHLTTARTRRAFRASALQTWREVVAAA